MPSINKQTCPTCGQSANKRIVKYSRPHLTAMLKIWRWMKKTGRSSATTKELKAGLTHVEYARLGEWKMFAPEAVFGKKGEWSLNMAVMDEIVKGNRRFNTVIEIDPLDRDRRFSVIESGTIRDAKNITEFLDQNEQFIAEYTGRVDLTQGALL